MNDVTTGLRRRQKRHRPVAFLSGVGNRIFAAADATARRNGWQITVRWYGLARTYRDPRYDLLVHTAGWQTVRAAGWDAAERWGEAPDEWVPAPTAPVGQLGQLVAVPRPGRPPHPSAGSRPHRRFRPDPGRGPRSELEEL